MNCILKILSILNILISEYAKVLNVCLNMLYLRVLNINTSSYLFDRILKKPKFQNMH